MKNHGISLITNKLCVGSLHHHIGSHEAYANQTVPECPVFLDG